VFFHLQDHIRASLAAAGGEGAPEPLRWFLTGGAGVGKSFVINLLRELILRAYPQGQDPVLLAAPTGKC
jgi:hypothetical protein